MFAILQGPCVLRGEVGSRAVLRRSMCIRVFNLVWIHRARHIRQCRLLLRTTSASARRGPRADLPHYLLHASTILHAADASIISDRLRFALTFALGKLGATSDCGRAKGRSGGMIAELLRASEAQGLSASEQDYYVSGIRAGVRVDGRSLLDVRDLMVETGVLPSAAGSARVHFGETDVLVGVHTVIGDETEGQGHRVPRTLGEALNFQIQIPGALSRDSRDGANVAMMLQQRLEAVFNALDEKALHFEQRILVQPNRMWWQFSIQVLVLRTRGLASLLDASAAALRAALRSTQVPRLHLLPEDEDALPKILLDEKSGMSPQLLDAKLTPMTLTLCQVGGILIADPDAFEELCADAFIQVAMDKAGRVCGLFVSSNEHGIEPTSIVAAVKAAREVCVGWLESVDLILDEDLKELENLFVPRSSHTGFLHTR
ncbi:Exosome complex exonuclease RRP42 [Porphyridium purpureum]|uniref:Ribosomal RNA-processing protein 42 n=1 Tax=Porphyridium purpureum TaxID=35688 RepID=A0A5J4ZAX6_PORPP|nr:Exosome complex exonuclease RRP42 [Porphyridium purpureum]|eukprot:POR6060..scf295_1